MADTICAISTPIGIGGIAMIRVSGDNSIDVVKRIFKFPEKIESHRIYYGHIVYENEVIDEVLVTVMLAPKSYTRENVVEINCHGGYIVARKILEILLKIGARLAEPGEFTKRAFLNGRIDLVQAEAVVNVINSKSEVALKIFEKQLKGDTKKEIEKLKDNFIEISSYLESYIDFDEDVEDIDLHSIRERLEELYEKIIKITDNYEKVKNFIEGVNIVIAGAPNSGKSSLLNYFLKTNRAIISEIPGTTRDTIEEEIFFKNFPVKLIDTAGIRETEDIIEKEGVKRTFDKLEEADIVIYLYDVEKGLDDYEKDLIKDLKNNKKIIVCANKIDKNEKIEISKDILPISVKKNINLDVLEDRIVKLLEENSLTDESLIITSIRQRGIFENIKNILERILNNFENYYVDMLAVEIREILNEIGKLTGEITTEDILDNIFSQFCIGK